MTVFKSWSELEQEITKLFSDENLINYKSGVLEVVQDIINHIRDNEKEYQTNEKAFHQFITQTHLTTMPYWLPYLSGSRAKLVDLSFVDQHDKEVEREKLFPKLVEDEDREAYEEFKKILF